MSNVLVPFLTGATSHAEHYIAVAVGLRWAKAEASRVVDGEIWSRFRFFERGLKQFWHRHPSNRPARRRYLGKREIAAICDGLRPNVNRPILVDERGVGLLGNYIESIRAIGLASTGSIAIDDTAVSDLLGDPRFDWTGTSPANWGALDGIFAKVDQPRAWPRLGHRLFDGHDFSETKMQMFSAAKTARANVLGDWGRLAGSPLLLEPQRRVAKATGVVTEIEEHLRQIFEGMLAGQAPTIAGATARKVLGLAGKVLELNVINTVWPHQTGLAQVILKQFEGAAKHRLTANSVLRWHLEVMRSRGTDPWIQEIGERSALRLAGDRAEPDFRLGNLRTLLRETRWAG